MERKAESQKRRTALSLPVYLGYLVVCTLLLTGVTFSSFLARTNASAGAAVAGCNVVVNGTTVEGATITYGEAQDNTYTYSFSVLGESEVALSYDVVVKCGGSLPDGVSLTLDGKDPVYQNGAYVFLDAGTLEAGTNGSATAHQLEFFVDHDVAKDQQLRAGLNATISVLAEQIS